MSDGYVEYVFLSLCACACICVRGVAMYIVYVLYFWVHSAHIVVFAHVVNSTDNSPLYMFSMSCCFMSVPFPHLVLVATWLRHLQK